jgi:hypothetical protein
MELLADAAVSAADVRCNRCVYDLFSFIWNSISNNNNNNNNIFKSVFLHVWPTFRFVTAAVCLFLPTFQSTYLPI